MVAKQRVHTPCPPSARTTTEISELTGMISGLVQRQALLTALLTGLLRQTGSERPAKATATAARKPALLTGLPSKSAVPVKHMYIICCFSHHGTSYTSACLSA